MIVFGSLTPVTVRVLAPTELLASKTVALLTRAAPRDLYYLHSVIRLEKIHGGDVDVFRKYVAFYSAISGLPNTTDMNLEKLRTITPRKVKTELVPVIRRGDGFDLESSLQLVESWLASTLTLTANDRSKDLSRMNHFIPL